ncbi:hypothetical protein HPC49_09925 [Pyxidicoccus fallax]|uniref:Uncharacterized protein n=1 Tax=Pyxidicoccus fallax TaxID=394095 RepID=A0A848LIJ7_9BACT|nr:hypothetical protein [Pyxidicoccus fallax]NMO17547.1 hypothetical protein [Pyxidicoccus fallax]NPC78559.1 hypothetical protein [Pyxidicoccus fallax]
MDIHVVSIFEKPMWLDMLFNLVLALGLPLLVLWLRSPARNARDVVGPDTGAPAGRFRRTLEFTAWALPAGAVLGLLGLAAWVVVDAQVHQLDLFSGRDLADPHWAWMVVPNAVVVGGILFWMRATGRRAASRDVLGLLARS